MVIRISMPVPDEELTGAAVPAENQGALAIPQQWPDGTQCTAETAALPMEQTTGASSSANALPDPELAPQDLSKYAGIPPTPGKETAGLDHMAHFNFRPPSIS